MRSHFQRQSYKTVCQSTQQQYNWPSANKAINQSSVYISQLFFPFLSLFLKYFPQIEKGLETGLPSGWRVQLAVGGGGEGGGKREERSLLPLLSGWNPVIIRS